MKPSCSSHPAQHGSCHPIFNAPAAEESFQVIHYHARDAFPDWGPNVTKVDAPLNILRKAIPVPTMHTMDTAWEVNLKTSVELYTIWEATGVLDQLETIDENLFDVVSDVMDEKRDEYNEWLEEQKEDQDAE